MCNEVIEVNGHEISSNSTPSSIEHGLGYMSLFLSLRCLCLVLMIFKPKFNSGAYNPLFYVMQDDVLS